LLRDDFLRLAEKDHESFENWIHPRSKIFFDYATSRFAAKAKLALKRSNIAFAGAYAATAWCPKNI